MLSDALQGDPLAMFMAMQQQQAPNNGLLGGAGAGLGGPGPPVAATEGATHAYASGQAARAAHP
jgi:hypothetical protein